MDNDFEARIRTRAYELWEKDASPEGVADEYWERALRQLAAEGVIGQDAATTPKDQSAKHRLAEPIPDEPEPTGPLPP
jgi:hypothetical protein